jgi:hypothetical protein
VGTVLFFVWWSGLRPGQQSPISDLRVTDDRFALVLSQTNPGFNRKAVDTLLGRFHPVSIQERDLTNRATGRVAS